MMKLLREKSQFFGQINAKKWPKTFKILPKCKCFAESGHTGRSGGGGGGSVVSFYAFYSNDPKLNPADIEIIF